MKNWFIRLWIRFTNWRVGQNYPGHTASQTIPAPAPPSPLTFASDDAPIVIPSLIPDRDYLPAGAILVPAESTPAVTSTIIPADSPAASSPPMLPTGS